MHKKKKLEECDVDFYNMFPRFSQKKKKMQIKIKNKIVRFIKNLLT